MHVSFLSHAKGRYFWLALLLVVACITIYVNDEPNETPNGGTPLGYALGTLGALMILWLAYLGRRKRNFLNGWGTARGWVSAHVYLGMALVVVATLHTGFQFDWNIHTLAYILMSLVILSGLFGTFAYSTYPAIRNDIKKSQTLNDIFLQVEDLDAQLLAMIANLDNAIKGVVTSAIERTVIGGGYFDQLLGRDKSVVVIDGTVVNNRDQQQALDFLVGEMTHAQGDQTNDLKKIIRAFNTRIRLLDVIREDIRMHAIVQVWLMFHVPLTFALLAALLAHVYAVFVYW